MIRGRAASKHLAIWLDYSCLCGADVREPPSVDTRGGRMAMELLLPKVSVGACVAVGVHVPPVIDWLMQALTW